MSRDVEQRYLQVAHLSSPMPADDALDADWDAWADLQQIQAILAGWASQVGRRHGLTRTDEDETYLQEIRDLASRPGVGALLGELATDTRADAAEPLYLLPAESDDPFAPFAASGDV